MDQSRLKYVYCLCQISSSEVILADATSEWIGVYISVCLWGPLILILPQSVELHVKLHGAFMQKL